MEERVSWRPGNMLYPVPAALISSTDSEGRHNVFTAAWVGTICSDPAMTYVSIRPQRYSHEIISASRCFVINLTTRALCEATDYCGVVSGRDIDKFEKMNLTALPGTKVNAPLIAESPVNLECEVREILNLGTHDMFMAEIVAVNVDPQYLDEKGKFHLEHTDLIAYSHGKYYTLGEEIGHFGYSVRKKAEPVKDKPVKKSEAAKDKFARQTDAAKVKSHNKKEVLPTQHKNQYFTDQKKTFAKPKNSFNRSQNTKSYTKPNRRHSK